MESNLDEQGCCRYKGLMKIYTFVLGKGKANTKEGELVNTTKKSRTVLIELVVFLITLEIDFSISPPPDLPDIGRSLYVSAEISRSTPHICVHLAIYLQFATRAATCLFHFLGQSSWTIMTRVRPFICATARRSG